MNDIKKLWIAVWAIAGSSPVVAALFGILPLPPETQTHGKLAVTAALTLGILVALALRGTVPALNQTLKPLWTALLGVVLGAILVASAALIGVYRVGVDTNSNRKTLPIWIDAPQSGKLIESYRKGQGEDDLDDFCKEHSDRCRWTYLSATTLLALGASFLGVGAVSVVALAVRSEPASNPSN